MADVATVNPVDEKITVIDGIKFRGILPTVDSLTKKIERMEKALERAEKIRKILPTVRRKLVIIQDPRWKDLREKAERDAIVHKADKAENLLASLPADVRAAIMAKLSGK